MMSHLVQSVQFLPLADVTHTVEAERKNVVW